MNWFAIRQHRKQFLTFGALLAIYAAIAIPTGLHFWHTYQYALGHCKDFATVADPRGSCDQLSSALFQSNLDATLRLLPLSLLLLPAVLGMFWGAPLLAKEYTEGTKKLAWTQSVSRKKWLSVKLMWVLTGAVVFSAGFAALSTWWSRPINDVFLNRFNTGIFGTQGIVPVAATIFAVAMGIAAGAWFRRTMAAVGVTLGVFIVLGFIVLPSFVRSHYMKPITVTSQMGPGAIDAKIPVRAWILNRNIVDKNGKSFNSFDIQDMPAQCQQIIQNAQVSDGGHVVRVKVAPGDGDPVDVCLNQAGIHQIATYQPGSRYWRFQWTESGIYLGLAALAIGATYWFVLKRDA